ncbi:MAG: PAS domain-containing protein [Synergistaceae bacterium]|jgi:two-component system phosphate regulon sensor histidine kinase PhoR|nr:PAS domain-containing protein [Synergistaceae bacterium]
MKRAILVFACALAGFSILLTAVLIHFAVYWSFSEHMEQAAALESRYIGRAVERLGTGYLRSIESDGSDEPDERRFRVTLISKTGTVLYDTDGDAAEMENHLDRPEVRAALEKGSGESTRFSGTLRKRTYYRAMKLEDGSVLRVAGTTDSVFASMLRLTPLTLAIAAAVFFAAMGIGARVTRKIVAPINRLNLEAPEDNVAYEELDPLLFRVKRQNDRIAAQMRELRQKELEFSAITANMREGLLVLDREGCVLSCNQSALTLLKAGSGDPRGRSVLTLRRDEAFRRAVESALGSEPKKPERAEASLQVGGRHLWVMANPVMDEGELQGAVLVLLDVTEREDRERLRREFSANVSHELRTPLTAISGYAEILANGVAKLEDAPRFAERIYAEAQRLIALVGDVMMLSRLDEGGGESESEEFKRERVGLGEIVRSAVESLGDLARSRNISVVLDLPGKDDEITITGIRTLLVEMALNLLDNAVKYNVNGGEVRVSAGRTGAAGKTENAVFLTVADTGIGIPPEEQERVFERFYRVEKSRAEKSRNGAAQGTGLGLSIVRHGALLHNAKIDLQSDGKSGTSITLLFPGP